MVPQSALAIADGPGALLTAIVTLAKDETFDVTKLEALMKMQERMEDRQAERAFARALHDAQAEIPHIAKNGTVSLGSGKGSYAFTTWTDMDRVLRPVMDRHGFTLKFDMQQKEGGGAVITGTLLHVDGHSAQASIPLALDAGPGRNNLQAMGSTMSYGRRYVAEMLFNLVRAGVDDDGRAGGAKFISQDDADELREMCKAAGRQEGPFLDRVFAGSEIRAFEEIEQGAAYLAAKNTLAGLIKSARKGDE
tara:strand:- start:952 stop:1701 length:750 start_codon:yes stop_codon:yes gene_type:complete